MTTTFDFNFRECLSVFKGASLHVLMALVLHQNERGRCWPSNDLLMRETGKGSGSITEALKHLEGISAVVRVPHEHRIGKEKDLHQRKNVWQLTGILVFEEVVYPYLYMTPEAAQGIIDSLEILGKHSISKCLKAKCLISEHKVYTGKEKETTKEKDSSAVGGEGNEPENQLSQTQTDRQIQSLSPCDRQGASCSPDCRFLGMATCPYTLKTVPAGPYDWSTPRTQPITDSNGPEDFCLYDSLCPYWNWKEAQCISDSCAPSEKYCADCVEEHAAPGVQPTENSSRLVAPIVVNFYNVSKHWNQYEEQWDSEQYLYIGRTNTTFMLGGSFWRNEVPIRSGTTREQTIAMYRQRICNDIPYLERLPDLTGKILVCWCEPEACHGDVLVELWWEHVGNVPSSYTVAKGALAGLGDEPAEDMIRQLRDDEPTPKAPTVFYNCPKCQNDYSLAYWTSDTLECSECHYVEEQPAPDEAPPPATPPIEEEAESQPKVENPSRKKVIAALARGMEWETIPKGMWARVTKVANELLDLRNIDGEHVPLRLDQIDRFFVWARKQDYEWQNVEIVTSKWGAFMKDQPKYKYVPILEPEHSVPPVDNPHEKIDPEEYFATREALFTVLHTPYEELPEGMTIDDLTDYATEEPTEPDVPDTQDHTT